MRLLPFTFYLLPFAFPALLRAAAPPLLHPAFDHLGNIADQSDTATASGANLLFCTGIGSLAYAGLPPQSQLDQALRAATAYARHAHSIGIHTALAYQCATSIVHLESFDQNWPQDLRAHLSSPPKDWLQQDPTGHPLPSWYAPPYAPACMNNPDWRTYQKYILKLQLQSGYDGVFFDNPTVHPQGCCCPHCMKKFAAFLANPTTDPTLHAAPAPHVGSALADAAPFPSDLPSLRRYAQSHPKAFLRFRATIAADFLKDMRAYARTLNPHALITCNNSLNAPEAFFSQIRTYGYNIHALSQAEDFVTIEDMATQPRTLPDGTPIEYAPVYSLLHAVAHHKPVIATTLADADYTTPPNLTRLAMSEAAIHGAAYLAWPTWPEPQRQRMSAALRQQSDFLDRHAALFTNTTPVPDVALVLPHRHWLDTDAGTALAAARSLSANNVQFTVLTEDTLLPALKDAPPPALLLGPESLLTPDELTAVHAYAAAHPVLRSTTPADLADLHPAVTIDPPDPHLRATLRKKDDYYILHLLNLNTRKLSSFEDQTTPATHIHLRLRLPKPPRAITAHTPDQTRPLPFTPTPSTTDLTVPRVDLHTILVLD